MSQPITQSAIERALAAATDTRSLVVGVGALAAAEREFEHCFGDRAAIVVADETTLEIAGRRVEQVLRSAGRTVLAPFVFPLHPPLHADLERVIELQAALSRSDAVPVAVGSGTLNDLTKLASHRLGRPCMVVATAASMDGYAAFGSSITQDGVKQTLACPAPRAILADLDLLATAPPALTAAGYGDLLGKVTAGADWLIADALEVEPLDPAIWSMVQPPLRQTLAEPERLLAGDRAAIESFFLGLAMSGLAMQAARSSRPASGSEHQFSHLWEMEGLSHRGTAPSHGFKVGIGTLASAALYERLLARGFDDLDVATLSRRWPTPTELEAAVRQTHRLPALAEKAVSESLTKHPTPEVLWQRLTLLRERWPDLRERLRAQLLPVGELIRMLVAAGCPADPAEIGVTVDRLCASYPAARQIRRRYTVLDLAAETDTLSACVDDLFGSEGFWGRAEPRP